MAELSVAIAELRTAIATPDADTAGVVRARFGGFVSEGPGPADWRLGIAPSSRTAPMPSGTVVKREGGDSRFTVGRADFAGTVDIERRAADVTLSGPGDIAIDSFLRILYSLALLESGALLLHAASLVRDGRAYVFCGRSGAGKTTVARLSPDATLLSDELSIVRATAPRALCFGTPFRGELALPGANRGAPLAGVYFLRQSDHHAREPLKPATALARLLPNVLFFAREADVTARAFDIAAELVEAVPCFDLAFRRDARFWEVIVDA